MLQKSYKKYPYIKPHNCFQHWYWEMFFEHQIIILEWFLKDRVLVHVIILLQFPAIIGINSILKYSKIEKLF